MLLMSYVSKSEVPSSLNLPTQRNERKAGWNLAVRNVLIMGKGVSSCVCSTGEDNVLLSNVGCSAFCRTSLVLVVLR